MAAPGRILSVSRKRGKPRSPATTVELPDHMTLDDVSPADGVVLVRTPFGDSQLGRMESEKQVTVHVSYDGEPGGAKFFFPPDMQTAVIRTLTDIRLARGSIDSDRFDGIVRASVAAAVPMQRGAYAQAQLRANLVRNTIARVALLTAREVGELAATKADNPSALVAQWSSRNQVFSITLAGHGVRYPAFQFEPISGKPYPALKKHLVKLTMAFSPIDLLLWFDSPHQAIGGRSPASVLHSDEDFTVAVEASFKPNNAW